MLKESINKILNDVIAQYSILTSKEPERTFKRIMKNMFDLTVQ